MNSILTVPTQPPFELLSTSASDRTSQLHLTLSRLILVFFTPSNTADHHRLFQWANEIILAHPTPPYRTYISMDNQLGQSWKTAILPILLDKMLNFAASYPRSQHCFPILEAIRRLWESSDSQCSAIFMRRVGLDKYWTKLRVHILAFVCLSQTLFHLLPQTQFTDSSLAPFILYTHRFHRISTRRHPVKQFLWLSPCHSFRFGPSRTLGLISKPSRSYSRPSQPRSSQFQYYPTGYKSKILSNSPPIFHSISS